MSSSIACKEINVWEEGCSSVEDSEECDPFNGEQRFVATAGQQLFTLIAFEYAPGTHSLAIHLNGLLVDPINVVELSPTTFYLQNETVLAGDIVVANALTGVTSEIDISITDLSTFETVLGNGQQEVIFSASVPIDQSSVYINGFGVDNGRLIEDTDYTVDTNTNTITLTDSYPADTILLLTYNDTADPISRLVTALYDFAVDGGTQGTINLSEVFPDNSTIARAWYEVLTAPTSGGLSTIAFGIETDDPAGLLAVTAFDDAAFSVGYHDFLPDGNAVNFTTKSAAVRDLIMVIADADLTDGKIRIWYEVLTSE